MSIFSRFRREKRETYEFRSLDGPTLFDEFSPSVKHKPENALAYAAVWAAVDRLASTVGTLPVTLYVRTANGKAEAKNHPLYRLLRIAPNRFQSGVDFFTYLMVSLLLRGNAYVIIYRNRYGQVSELMPVNPDRITPKLSEDKSELLFYLDNSPTPLGEVWHTMGLSLDGMTGVSPIEYAAKVIDAGVAAQDVSDALTRNIARPSGILTSPNTLDEQELKAIQKAWNANYSGRGQGKVAVLDNGLTFTPITISTADKQYIEQRQLSREDIAGIFSVPLFMLDGKAPSGQTEELFTYFYTTAIRPWLERLERSFERCVLLPSEQGTYYLKFNADAIMRANLATRTAAITQQMSAGLLSVNEARDLEDRPPVTHGNTFYAPLNLAHIDGGTGQFLYNGPQNPIPTQGVTHNAQESQTGEALPSG